MKDDRTRFLNAQRVRKEIAALTAGEQRRIRLGRKHYLRHERWEIWTEDLPVYLFWCGECERFSLDYQHGFIQNRYLTCQNCGTNTDFVPWWVAWVELWGIVKMGWKYLRR